MPWLAFHNNYSLPVSVAVMQVDSDACGGEYGGWATHGWWNLNPGESKTAIWTKYDAAYYYAKASKQWRMVGRRERPSRICQSLLPIRFMSAHRHVDMGCRQDETCGCGLVPVQYTYGELESLNLRAQRSGLGIETGVRFQDPRP
ncbi:Uncharacterised protein [Mycobacteroides abscessus subsp. abscessus]|nr:Uncharacterised protein [Mycobacteroides abscessus subsp. abscessus]SLE86223.1 Uncharacterised protein [Mycobacteroides abscessus subsp. abscessus]SLF57496.1 Uncharacterised protein [Mycobacteroides abscessus subsp. abscessus]SLG45659.1 Uncharacterised protein [Mycobacteroides abscessus subsp. abscessus]